LNNIFRELGRTFQILVFVFASTFHGRISLLRFRGTLQKQKGEDPKRRMEYSVKSGKHNTRTLSLVQNRARFKKRPANKYTLAFKGR
jgi:hypothetical protein